MNTPSTLGSNWCWRAPRGFASDELAARLRRQMTLYHRLAPMAGSQSQDASEKSEEN